MVSAGPGFSFWWFCLLSLVAAGGLLVIRPGRVRPAAGGVFVALALLPLALVLGLLAFAHQGGNGELLRITVNRLQVPLDAIVEGDDAAGTARFVVADKAEGTDLIIAPFDDAGRAIEAVGLARHPLAEVHARREPGGVTAWLCLYNIPADPAVGLSGWEVHAAHGGVTDAGNVCAPGQGDVSRVGLRPGKPVTVEIKLLGPINGTGRPVSRQRFDFTLSSNAIVVDLHKPLEAQLGGCGDNTMRLMPALPTRDDLGFLPENDLRFAALGGGGVHPLLAPALLGDQVPRSVVCAQRETAFNWPWRADTGRQRVSGTIVHTTLPWFFVALVGVGGLFFALLRGHYWRMRPVEGVAILGLQWLLGLRVLFAIAGHYHDPAKAALSRNVIFYDAAVAWLVLPAIALLPLMGNDRAERRQLPAIGLFVVAGYAAIAIWLGGAPPPPQARLIGVIFAIAWLARLSVRSPLSLLVLARQLSAGWPRGLDSFWLGLWIVVIAAALRIMLVGLGIAIGDREMKLTERVGPVMLSAVYQPVLIVGMALLVAGLLQRPTARRAALLTLVFTGGVLGVASAVRDFGIVVVYGWPVAVVIALLVPREAWGRARWPIVATALAVAPVLMPVALLPMALWLAAQDRPDPTRAPVGDLVAFAVDRNDDQEMRLIRWVAPEQVESYGNNAAEKLLVQASGMEPLGRGVWGSGYLAAIPIRGQLLRYQFEDNLPAIHVMAPFGRLGMVCLLLFYGAWSFALAAHRSHLDASHPDAVSIAGQMAALTLVWAGLYMAMANLNLVPFTGRNMYFLAVSSGSDPMEGLAMLMLAALPWLRRAPDPSEAAR